MCETNSTCDEKLAKNLGIERQVQADDINVSKESSSLEPQQKRKPILILINPHSGRGKSVTIYKKKIVPFLESHNIDYETFITQSDLRVSHYLDGKSTLEILKYRSIIVVSGDGLFHETINALLARKDWQQVMTVPIGVVPTGSGNGLAYTLLRQKHVDLENTGDAISLCCEQINQDESCLADLVKITYGPKNTVWSFLSLGWGLLADIDIDSEWLRRLGEVRFTVYGLLRSITSVSYLGRLSYKLADNQPAVFNRNSSNQSNTSHAMLDHASNGLGNLEQLNNSELSNPPAQPLNDWVHIEDKFACLYAVYQTHVSSVTKFSPKSTLTDQLIYLTYIRGKLSPCRVIEFLLAIEDGSHDKLPYVNVVPVTKFEFQPLEQSKVVVDGEVLRWDLSDGPITAEVVPKAMKILWSS